MQNCPRKLAMHFTEYQINEIYNKNTKMNEKIKSSTGFGCRNCLFEMLNEYIRIQNCPMYLLVKARRNNVLSSFIMSDTTHAHERGAIASKCCIIFYVEGRFKSKNHIYIYGNNMAHGYRYVKVYSITGSHCKREIIYIYMKEKTTYDTR